MYKLKYNFLIWLALNTLKRIFNMTNPIGYRDDDIILLVHRGKMNLDHSRELKLGLWAIMTEFINKCNEEGESYCVDSIGLDYMP